MKSGRPLATETILKTRKVVKLLENTNNSERDVAKKCGLTQTCVHNIKIRSGLKTKKCSTVPHHTEDQKRRAKTNCRKICEQSYKRILIIDDETYMKCEPSQNSSNDFFTYRDIETVPDSVRFKTNRELHKVWSNLSKEIAERCGQSLMKSVRQKLRLIGRQGVLAPYKH